MTCEMPLICGAVITLTTTKDSFNVLFSCVDSSYMTCQVPRMCGAVITLTTTKDSSNVLFSCMMCQVPLMCGAVMVSQE